MHSLFKRAVHIWLVAIMLLDLMKKDNCTIHGRGRTGIVIKTSDVYSIYNDDAFLNHFLSNLQLFFLFVFARCTFFMP